MLCKSSDLCLLKHKTYHNMHKKDKINASFRSENRLVDSWKSLHRIVLVIRKSFSDLFDRSISEFLKINFCLPPKCTMDMSNDDNKSQGYWFSISNVDLINCLLCICRFIWNCTRIEKFNSLSLLPCGFRWMWVNGKGTGVGEEVIKVKRLMIWAELKAICEFLGKI